MRRSPLLRRAALVRGGRLRRVAIKAVSDKRRAENRVRRRNVIEAFGDSPVCAICGQAQASDAHELLSRARGGSITDVSNIIPACRPCHTRVTEHPSWAESMFFALPSPARRPVPLTDPKEQI